MSTTKKKFSPAQLEAQRKFAERAKSGEFKRKAKASRKRKNQLGPAIIGGIGSALGSKLIESESDKKPAKNPHPTFSGTKWGRPLWARKSKRKKKAGFSFLGTKSRTIKAGSARRFNPESRKNFSLFGKKKKASAPARATKRKPTREQMNKAYRAHFGAARAKALKEISPARFGRNPKGQHLPGLSPAYQRMYEHIVQSPEAKKHYGDRLKEVAARTVRKAAAAGILPNSFYRANPTFFVFPSRKTRSGRWRRSGYGKSIGSVRAFTKWGAGRKAKRLAKRTGTPASFLGLSKVRRNQSADSLFKEFRGRAPRGKIIEAEGHGPDGKVIEVAELGKLREITLADGRRYEFGGSARLLADGAKRLHVTGVKYRSKPHDAGAIHSIVYRADKPHIETGRFDYEHKFGEEGGKRPHWVIDREGLPCIQGGSYGITADGILN